MQVSRRNVLAGAAATGALPLSLARAQAANTVRIGVMTDMSGMYRDNTGPTSVAAAREAASEFGASHGFRVEIIEADHQNRPDVGVNLARQWYDQGVDLIIDVPTSSVGLAVSNVAREKNKAYINVGSATADLTGAQCSPNTIHWAYDTFMLARSTGGATVRAGGDTWFF
ncbi:MAG: ABC transporter substrate-binding protein, partial [Alphaproteobacteria bacterium]